ncbi:MAG TPA: hypothetical protein VFB72_07355 [Verrucomicrobiae bacterium]|nr:hypothetical protein [Verrucomicrobiae bacterium]
MKVLIQNVVTGEYLTQNGTWSPLASHGRDFRGSSSARAVLRKDNASKLRALFYFEDFDYSINVKRSQGERLVESLCTGGLDF